MATYIVKMIVSCTIKTELNPSIWFHQYGATPHFDINVRNFLRDMGQGHKWIRRRGEVEWPLRYPELTPLVFFCGCI